MSYFPVFSFVLGLLLATSSCLVGDAESLGSPSADPSFSVPQDSVPSPCEPSTYWVFFDLTGSVSDDQVRDWVQIARMEVFNQFCEGDDLMVFPLHDNTAQSAPLFSGRVPSRNGQAGASALMAWRTEVKAFRARIEQALNSALVTDRSLARCTSILGAFELVRPSAGRRQRLFFFSDMLESGSSLVNLERTRLVGRDLSELVQKIMQSRQLSNSKLESYEVFCILDTRLIGQTQPVNPRRDLNAFWGHFISAMGGSLVWFQPYLVQEAFTAAPPVAD